MTIQAIVRSSDNTLYQNNGIRDLDPVYIARVKAGTDNLGVPGYVLMDVENVTADTHVTPYFKTVVTQGVNAGKWRVTTTVSDLAGAELTSEKAGRAGAPEAAVLEGLRLAMNGLLFLANDIRTRTSQATLTKAQFATAISDPSLNGVNNITRQETIDFLASKI